MHGTDAARTSGSGATVPAPAVMPLPAAVVRHGAGRAPQRQFWRQAFGGGSGAAGPKILPCPIQLQHKRSRVFDRALPPLLQASQRSRESPLPRPPCCTTVGGSGIAASCMQLTAPAPAGRGGARGGGG